jgi:predicted ATPase
MLSELGLDDRSGAPESVALLVGPNGSGKSTFLLELARRHRNERNVLIVCNTPHDRFAGLRRVDRMSAARTDGSARSVVKNSVAKSLSGSGAEFYRISSTLEYCGYAARFGFRVDPDRNYGESLDDLRDRFARRLPPDYKGDVEGVPLEDQVPVNPWDPTDDDVQLAVAFLRRHDPHEEVWIESGKDSYEFSRSREFASVLRLEARLRAWKVLRGIRVYLERADGGRIEIQHASSGQLSLISSLLFMIVHAGEAPVVIIDEPENSLHPNWQREYVDKVLAALGYRSPTVIIATHAPLVVTGALVSNPTSVRVFVIREGVPHDIHMDALGPTESIEEILWRAFHVVTPANHFVSERIVDEISRYERHEVPREAVLRLIDQMEVESFDERQRDFFAAVRTLVDQVGVGRKGVS